MSLESCIEPSGNSDFLRGISKMAKNKFIQYSLASLLTLTSACGGSNRSSENNTGENDPPVTNSAPVVYDIPDQTINEGQSFQQINLDNYVSDPDNSDAEINWTYSGNTDLTISINTRTATITPPDSSWTGEETITFKATDPQNANASDSTIFTINPIIPRNNNPTIISTPPATATEGSEYNYDVDASDPENDTLTFSLLQTPAFLTINPTTGLITGTPLDQHSDQTHTIEIKVDDGNGGSAKQLYTLFINNTELVSGNVKDILSSIVIGNAEVKIGSTPVYTGSNGDYVLTGILDGDYLIQVNEANYFTHNAGILRVSKEKNLEGKLTNIDYRIIPLTFNMDFFNETCRCNNATQRIPDSMFSTFQSYINTNPAIGSGATITQGMIDLAIDRIELEWPVLTDGKLNLTQANGRIQKGINPPAYPTNGDNTHHWNSTISSGGHAETLSGYEIIASSVVTNPNAPIRTYRQESAQTLGVRCDSNLVPSIFNDPMTQTDYLQVDYDIIKVLYNRPPGNKTPDDNPAGYLINP